ncbi:outer membrane beta-barrel protein [Glaciecola sp. MH2013]|uniref:outer membrane beta-barrel protein n=1 Tax=Glaciecola sp. MH2013 TaxID=2785524 RepID=UPI0018A02FFA|nr:outer membrane beta-barrel protein [Glaciecola sp. MH2013]MBF7074886.1 outer membrane beta-barrel protein [Glaciecola sp. MH2013]
MKLFQLGLLSVLTLSVSLVQAQQFEDAASIPVAGFDLTPSVDVGFRYDDNVIRSSQDEISSWSQIISPQVVMLTNFGSSQVNFGYRLRNERFYSSPADNYTDHFLSAGVDYELNARHRMDIAVDYTDGHEDRGTGFSIGRGELLTTPDKFKQAELDLLYSYGAFNADGRLEVNFNITNRDYDLTLPSYRARDRVFTGIGGAFYYRVGATTDLVIDIIYTDVDYNFALNSESPLDSTQVSYLIGLDWEATAQTSGYAKVGYQEKDFESELRDDFDGVDWEAGVIWEPVEYSSVELTTGASTNETNGEGDFIRGRDHQVEWRHEWLERLRTRVSYTWGNDRYEGRLVNNLAVRDDDLARFRASAYYQFRRWINVELSYIRDERDSNRDIISYDRNQLFFNMLFTL